MAEDKAGEVSSVLVTGAFNIRQKSLCLLLKSMGTTDDFSVDLWFFRLSPPTVRLDVFEGKEHISSSPDAPQRARHTERMR